MEVAHLGRPQPCRAQPHASSQRPTGVEGSATGAIAWSATGSYGLDCFNGTLVDEPARLSKVWLFNIAVRRPENISELDLDVPTLLPEAVGAFAAHVTLRVAGNDWTANDCTVEIERNGYLQDVNGGFDTDVVGTGSCSSAAVSPLDGAELEIHPFSFQIGARWDAP